MAMWSMWPPPAILALPNLSAYYASKFGVVGFSDALRQEMKKEKINVGVTMVCPNTVGTGMFAGSKMVAGIRNNQAMATTCSQRAATMVTLRARAE